MFPSEMIARIGLPDSECRFLESIETRGEPRLAKWAANYHFFSVHQARHLALMVGALDPSDRASLAEVALALYEEYGSGAAERVHSVLFARFAAATGVALERLPIPAAEVEPEVRAYVDEIEAAYSSGCRARALGAYCYLERSAVLSYGTMFEAFTRLGFDEAALEFFRIHVIQEEGHDAGAVAMADRLVSEEMIAVFGRQLSRMGQLWARFWSSFE